jgi:uncharacterized protein (DUF362 family)
VKSLKFGSVEFQENVDEQVFVKLVRSLNLKPPVVIKPNWGFSVIFTEAQILDWILSAIDDEAIVVESYGWARCREAVEEKKYGPFDRESLVKSDKWFLKYSGIDEVLKKHSVEYLNVTEEVWKKDTTDPSVIQSTVEESYSPVAIDEMYSYVPQRLYDMRGGSYLSLAKLKFMGDDIVISLALKNLFGMIPGPDRGRFHGEENKAMNPSIVDMNKIYRSLFDMKGIVEAVSTASRGMTLEPEIYKNQGIAWVCEDTLELDALVSAHFGIEPETVGHFMLAAETFGGWDEDAVSKASNNRLSRFD